MKGKIIYGGLRWLQRELEGERWSDASFVIMLDANTFEHCLPRLIATVERLEGAEFVEVPVGEECKDIDIARQVWQTMLEGGYDRNTVIVNLGGGCVSDLGGYVASGYMRGIRYINVPTSLVGMVDASIGGKTAINFHGIKNMIGHFHQPELTCIEPSFLGTLPETDILSGYIEMVKTAAVADPEIYHALLTDVHIPGRADIGRVARIKAAVVRRDPEDHGIRRILNFGHTFGHAIEAFENGRRTGGGEGISHGVAVGIGMMVAMYLSNKKIGLSDEVYDSYSKWFRRYVELPRYSLKDIEVMLQAMHHDKKNGGGETRCVLLQEPGAAMIDVVVSDNEIRDAFLRVGK